MPTVIDDLWGDTIPEKEVLDPIRILTSQVEPLKIRSRGELEALISVFESETKKTIQFDIIARRLENRRVTLLTATSEKPSVYPTTIVSKGLVDMMDSMFLLKNQVWKEKIYRNVNALVTEAPRSEKTLVRDTAIAYDENDFIVLAKGIFSSNATKSILQSLSAEVANQGREPDPSVIYMQAS